MNKLKKSQISDVSPTSRDDIAKQAYLVRSNIDAIRTNISNSDYETLMKSFTTLYAIFNDFLHENGFDD
jgi:hypothetical protein